MRRNIFAVTLMLACVTPASGSIAPLKAAAPRCRVVSGWPTLPSGEILGQATGVGVNNKGEVLVFHRAGRTWTDPFPTEPIAAPTVWVFDGKTGRFLRRWGTGMFIMPHGLTIDRNNNVWLTDVGLQQVLKFSPDGRLLFTLGERGIAAQTVRTSTFLQMWQFGPMADFTLAMDTLTHGFFALMRRAIFSTSGESRVTVRESSTFPMLSLSTKPVGCTSQIVATHEYKSLTVLVILLLTGTAARLVDRTV